MFNFSLADGWFNDWSPLSPICPCAIQLTSGERPVYDSTFSSSLSSRSARKTQVRSRKNIGTGKNTFGSRKKRLAAGKSYFRSGKNASKKCRFAAGQIQSSRKTPSSSTKAPLQQKNAFWRQREKPAKAGKNQQQRKSSFATQKIAAMEKIHFRNGKKQQPLFKYVSFARGSKTGPSTG